MRRLARILGTVLIVGGALTLAWAVVVWRWQDPFTALYTHFQQIKLAHRYERKVAEFHAPVVAHASLAAEEQAVASVARAYRRSLHEGDPVGRLRIGRIGLNMVVVQGTEDSTLEKGPGHYTRSWLPGQGHLIYIAGHRTTFLAPFAYINNIRVGDYVTFSVPYGTFTYRVTRHYIVPSNALSVLRDHGHEVLRLQACHPRFFATHRYIVDATLVSVAPRGGHPYTPSAASHLAAPARAATS
ncbi:MAG TPA: class D sortase [Gaiellaceae bacterium]|nr:class D sortase [Gaiellaceae bacterium]